MVDQNEIIKISERIEEVAQGVEKGIKEIQKAVELLRQSRIELECGESHRALGLLFDASGKLDCNFGHDGTIARKIAEQIIEGGKC